MCSHVLLLPRGGGEGGDGGGGGGGVKVVVMVAVAMVVAVTVVVVFLVGILCPPMYFFISLSPSPLFPETNPNV